MPTPPAAPARREWTLRLWGTQQLPLAAGPDLLPDQAVGVIELHPGDVIVGTEARRWFRCYDCGRTFEKPTKHSDCGPNIFYKWQCVVELPE